MKEKGCLIDVIVPVCNGEKYLKKCVDSLLRQELQDYCITLVDDGSTDATPAICDDYAARFPERIRVIHKENEGPSAARNAAVGMSQSELIAFVDSDDHVSERYLSSMYEALVRFDADMVISPVCKEFFRADGSSFQKAPPTLNAMLMGRDKALEELCYEKYFSSFPVGKLLPRETVLAHPFPVGRYFEDSFAIFRYIMDCTKIAYIPEISYYYYQRPGSIQHNFFEQRHQDLLDASKEILRVFSENNMPSSVMDAAAYKLCRACYVTLFHAADLDRPGYEQVYRRVAPIWQEVYAPVIKQKRLSAREKLLFRMARKNRRFFYTLVKLSERRNLLH